MGRTWVEETGDVGNDILDDVSFCHVWKSAQTFQRRVARALICRKEDGVPEESDL